MLALVRVRLEAPHLALLGVPGLAGHEHHAALVPDRTLEAEEAGAAETAALQVDRAGHVLGVAGVGVGDVDPVAGQALAHALAARGVVARLAGDREHLQPPAVAQPAGLVGQEAVEAVAGVAVVLGHVDDPAARVDRGALVLEATHGLERVRLDGSLRPRRDLEDVAVRLLEAGAGAVGGLLAGQPGAPRRRRPAAVAQRAVEDQEALDQPALLAPQRRGDAAGRGAVVRTALADRARRRTGDVEVDLVVAQQPVLTAPAGAEQGLPVVGPRGRQAVAHRGAGAPEGLVAEPARQRELRTGGSQRPEARSRVRRPRGRGRSGRRRDPGRPGRGRPGRAAGAGSQGRSGGGARRSRPDARAPGGAAGPTAGERQASVRGRPRGRPRGSCGRDREWWVWVSRRTSSPSPVSSRRPPRRARCRSRCPRTATSPTGPGSS